MTITIFREDARWKGLLPTVRRAAEAAMADQKIRGEEVAIMLADDARVRGMNRDYRGKDKPTNVLSFPSEDEGYLGDIILAYETVAREAQEQGKTLKAHLTHLVVHGVLHLVGFDHEIEAEAEEMEAREVRILKRMGIGNPYE